jgi:FeS assembly protein IscX
VVHEYKQGTPLNKERRVRVSHVQAAGKSVCLAMSWVIILRKFLEENLMPNGLTWDDTNKIGILLVDTHPAVAPDKIGLNVVHDYVIALSDFKGDPAYVHEPTLEAIRQAWNTEFLERTRNWA